MEIYRTEMSIPVQVTQGTVPQRAPISVTIPVVQPNQKSAGNMSLKPGGMTSLTDRFDRNTDDFFRLGDSDRFFDDMHRRFAEKRKRWDEDMRRMESEFFKTSLSTTPFAVESPRRSISSDYAATTQFARDEDGVLHFTAKFDIRDLDQNNLKVSIKDGQIVVSAKVEGRSKIGTTTKQLFRAVDLPKGVQESEISATLITDGILEVDCPIRPIRFQSPSFSSGSASRTSEMGTPSSISQPSRYYGASSPVSQISSFSVNNKVTNNSSKFHVEISIGADYKPEEIQIRTLNNRVYISARHEERVANRNTFREFAKEYDIPDHIDPTSINARLVSGVLHLEGVPLC